MNNPLPIIGFTAFRKGSKRLINKNGLKLGEKALYEITIDKLLRLKEEGYLQEVVASTDCREWINDCTQKYGNRIIIHQRSEQVSNDEADESVVLLEFIERYSQYKECSFMLTLCTYPFLQIELFKEIISKYKEAPNTIFSVRKEERMPQKLLRIDPQTACIKPYLWNNQLEFECNSKKLKLKYPEPYISTGIFLLHDTYNQLKKNRNIWHNEQIHTVLDNSFHLDIDNKDDFELATLRYLQTGNYQ